MKLSGFLNKPRWQSKEAAVRRAGVAGDDDPELVANLAAIAREDQDPGVRSAALKRLADPSATQRAARDDADAGVRADARRIWFDLIAGLHPRAPSALECERLLRAQDDAALIEHVARNATDAGLRAAALARVTRTALLSERVTTDPSPELRLAALERIDDEAMLDRLAERTRKTDKRVSRRARERADMLRIARGDPAVAETVARALCERLEKHVRAPQSAEALAEIDAQWAAIEARAGDSLRSRYRAAHALLAESRVARTAPEAAAPVEPKAEIAEATPTAEPAPDSPPAATEPASPSADEATPTRSVDPLLAQARFAASLSAASAGRQTEDQERRRAEIARVEAVVAEFESAVGDGAVARAHAAHARIATLRKEAAAAFTRALQRRIAEAERRYSPLSQWQHWGDNQRRRQLCETIEELAGSGLHPDAIATRVREAQAEWSKLDAAEGHAPGQSMHGWARRFHAACRRALEPAKSYFRKRQELRKTHAQAIATALEHANAIPPDSTDWPLIARTRHAIVDALRTLDRIDPHERKTLAKRLKAALGTLDERLSGHQAEVERAKAALIVEAEALAADEPRRGAAAAARELQQRWRDAGSGRRDRDQSQWKTFRAALDTVFGKLDAERAQRSVRDAGSRGRGEALCAEFEQLAQAPTPPQRAAVARIEAEWDALRIRDDGLLRRFRAVQSSLRDAGMRHERTSRRKPYEAWLARYALCRLAEASEDSRENLRDAWEAAPHGDVAAAALATRFDAALNQRGENASAPASAQEQDESAREVLIRIEIFAGLESPREDQDRRRELQVERLSARMRGAAAATPHQELAALLTRWTELGPAPATDLEDRLRRGLAAAIETLP